MKKQAIIFICLLLLLSFTSSKLQAQSNQAVATGHVFAEIITALSAVETSQMNFGRFSPGPYGGQIILTPQGSISVTGSIVKASGFHNAASFYLTGDNATSFSISMPGNPIVLTNTTNAKTMRISNWVTVPSTGPTSSTLEEGFMTVYVGATLEVGTIYDNPVGIYRGTYEITFDFN